MALRRDAPDGQVQVDQDAADGTSGYRVRAPDDRPGAQVGGWQGPHTAPRAHGVLVVDDEAALRGWLNLGMRQEGFAVWLAADGQEALDVYRRHHEAIDVVLLDVRMPGLDGPHTLVALQAFNPQIRCCFMSGDLGSYTPERLRELGASAFLQKPFHLAEVARMLGEQARDVSRMPSRP